MEIRSTAAGLCVLAAAGKYEEALKELLAAAEQDPALAAGQVRPVMVKVFRMLGPDGRPASGPDGAPAYFYQTQNVTQILTPDEYKIMTNRELQE